MSNPPVEFFILIRRRMAPPLVAEATRPPGRGRPGHPNWSLLNGSTPLLAASRLKKALPDYAPQTAVVRCGCPGCVRLWFNGPGGRYDHTEARQTGFRRGNSRLQDG